MAKDVPLGTRFEVTLMVEHKHTLAAHNPDLPPVLSTPWMIAWMEYACWEAQQPFCDDGETTVGTAIHVDHRAPATVGQVVTASAILEKIEGRFFIYRVSARRQEVAIGSGTVHRTVVNVNKFMMKTQRSSQ